MPRTGPRIIFGKWSDERLCAEWLDGRSEPDERELLRDEIHRRAERAAHQLAVLLDNIFVPFSERDSAGGVER